MLKFVDSRVLRRPWWDSTGFSSLIYRAEESRRLLSYESYGTGKWNRISLFANFPPTLRDSWLLNRVFVDVAAKMIMLLEIIIQPHEDHKPWNWKACFEMPAIEELVELVEEVLPPPPSQQKAKGGIDENEEERGDGEENDEENEAADKEEPETS
ncbi:unnamed protein product [Dovyalis caffra]|uniref:Uncharacterized protein n=1 Tax=Dovyalis caffra TaxID=77055 RepID=A0AAV1SQ77_9ROSI|nr:unnamed protein product [Dovyalis caffra]